MRNVTITRMKARRLQLGYTQQELAEKIGVTQPRISSWECGRADLPPKRRRQIARVLDCDPDTLTDPLA